MSDKWHDYVGNQVWVDYDVDVSQTTGIPTAVPQTTYDVGLGSAGILPAVIRTVGIGGTRWFHADMLGSTRLITDGSGSITVAPANLTYTAFGERLPLAAPFGPGGGSPITGLRYGFAGAWGYQNDALSDADNDIGLLHVGARYYDPSIGRFVMRDPIGIWGGVNVYGYIENLPTRLVDPEGLTSLGEVNFVAARIATMLATLAPVIQQGSKLAQTLINRGYGNNPEILRTILTKGKEFQELATGRVLMYYDRLALVLEYGDDAWTIITFIDDYVNPTSNPNRFVPCVPRRVGAGPR